MMLRKSKSNCAYGATYSDTRWSANLDPWRQRYSVVKQLTHNMVYRPKVVYKSQARWRVRHLIRLRDPLHQHRVNRKHGKSGRLREVRLCIIGGTGRASPCLYFAIERQNKFCNCATKQILRSMRCCGQDGL